MVKWVFRTHAGKAQIVPTPKGFAIVFAGETLEYHSSPAAAAEALAKGACPWPSAGDPSNMGIPESISEWQRLP
ncbi:hypothetical protein GCM10007857_66870 [Bradyrhizobium iriomotense]|uniref:Uncharacterized protein n=1 Tax=Bradyrhizobium iriomotense TaxID=441950 RepID=A0ABQ6B870_9BRAD|nr:hypothetical protein GCM10007857_66870 [Bradyrhizobium iriomotense]